MRNRNRLLLYRSFPGQVLLISGIIVACCVAIGFVSALELMKLQESVSTAVALKHPSSPWGRELKVAKKAFSTQGEGPQEPWGAEEIRWYVAANFKSLGPAEKRELVKAIHEESRSYGLAPQLILSVIAVESDGDPALESPKGALGLMQLQPETAKDLAQEVSLPWSGKESLLRPSTNVRLGTRYLFQMVQRYRDLPLALCAYYLGPGRLDRLLMKDEEPPWQYASKVLGIFQAPAISRPVLARAESSPPSAAPAGRSPWRGFRPL